MKPIAKIDTRLQRTAYGKGALVMGLLFALVGVFFALGGFGVFPLPGKAHAPLWVIGAMGIAFALSGLVLVGHSLRGLAHGRRVAAARRKYMHRPWMLDYPWDPSGVADPAAERWIGSLIGFMIMAVFLVPFHWWAFLSREGPLPVKIFVGLFDLILALVFLSLIYRLLQYAKYGRSWLAFSRFPFAPGERLEVRFSPVSVDRLSATLRFVEERMERSGRGSSRNVSHRSYEHYRETRELVAEPGATELAIGFDLPDNKDWVTRLTADPGIRYWELLLEASAPGIDFRTSFPLPVYDSRAAEAVVPPARHSPRAARSRIPYAFELGLPLGLAALVAVLWLISPALVVDTVEAVRGLWARTAARVALRPLDGPPDRSAMALGLDTEGRVWALTKYGLTRWESDDPEVLVDPRRYQGIFGHRINALSALRVAGSDEAWVGSWYGELFHYREGDWRQLSTRDRPLGSRIYAFAPYGGDLYLGTSRGLWVWSRPQGTLTRVEALPLAEVQALDVSEDGSLCAGAGRALWCLGKVGWQRLWEAGAPITALAPRPEGDWLVGTRDGFVSLLAHGEVAGRGLEGRQVKGFVRSDDGLWVATWRDGVFERTGQLWRRWEMANVNALERDPAGNLWLAVYGDGVYRLSFERAKALME